MRRLALTDKVVQLWNAATPNPCTALESRDFVAGYGRLVETIESTIPMLEIAARNDGQAHLKPIAIAYRWALKELYAAQSAGPAEVKSVAMVCGLLEALAQALPKAGKAPGDRRSGA